VREKKKARGYIYTRENKKCKQKENKRTECNDVGGI
jgi:hypothetical protein